MDKAMSQAPVAVVWAEFLTTFLSRLLYSQAQGEECTQSCPREYGVG